MEEICDKLGQFLLLQIRAMAVTIWDNSCFNNSEPSCQSGRLLQNYEQQLLVLEYLPDESKKFSTFPVG